MTKFPAIAVLISIAAGAAAETGGTFGRNNARVNPVSASVFEVIPRASSGKADDIWCSASDFALRRLNARWQDQIFVVRGYAVSETTGRPTSVQFSLDAANVRTDLADARPGGGFAPGDSMKVQIANMRCNRLPRMNDS